MKISPYPPIYEVVQEKNDVRVIFETLEEEDVNESIFITLQDDFARASGLFWYQETCKKDNGNIKVIQYQRWARASNLPFTVHDQHGHRRLFCVSWAYACKRKNVKYAYVC